MISGTAPALNGQTEQILVPSTQGSVKQFSIRQKGPERENGTGKERAGDKREGYFV